MTVWAVLAPGPSATAEQAARVAAAGLPLGAVGCAYQLAPNAEFVASSDRGWWRNYPDALKFPQRFAMMQVADVEQVAVPGLASVVNSGVLALECAKRSGATCVLLLGVDMHGTHFFGPYKTLRNTQPAQREQHKRQYAEWGRLNQSVRVVNCTPGSALECFEKGELDACLAELAERPARAA